MKMITVLYILIMLHAADGASVEINVDQITSLRSPTKDVEPGKKLFPPSAHCLVNLSDGKFVAVQEDCPTIRRMIEGR